MDTASNLISLNSAEVQREQWIHLLPAGRFDGRDGRGPYELTDPAAVMQRTREYQGQTQIAVDYEHQSIHAAKTGAVAPAAGWIKGLQARDNGIWGLVEWTEPALQRVRAKEFRYLSPVFTHTRGVPAVVTRIQSVALTQYPNLELTSINRTGALMDPMEELRQLLGLPDDADAAALVGKVKELTAGAAHAVNPTQYVPIGDFERTVAELKKFKQGVTEKEAAHAVDQAISGGELPPFLRDWGISVCSINKPAFDQFLQKTSGNVKRLFEPSGLGARGTRGAAGGDGLTAEETAVCSAMGLTPEEFRKANPER